MRSWLIILVASLVTGATAATAVDPDDLAALLSDLEASGGILDAADLASLLESPAPTPTTASRGSWSLGLTGRETATPRTDFLVERRGGAWAGRLRARRDASGQRSTGWLRGTTGALGVAAGGGTLVHGTGLLAAPPGRRSSLAADAPLRPPRPGWRTSSAMFSAAVLTGGAVDWSARHWQATIGAGRDQEGRPAHLARAGMALGATGLAVATVSRGGGRGAGLDLRWHRDAWRLAAEVARWRLPETAADGGAWCVTASWRSPRWRAEAQAAASGAVDGLEGALRPACLPGWRGRGWALRLAGQPASRVSAALVLGQGQDRDASAAATSRDEESLLGLRLRISSTTGTIWELRLRRRDDGRRRWSEAEPWLPAVPEDRRLRTWLAGSATVPTEAGEARLVWRRLEEGGEARQLLAARWTADRRWGRWRFTVRLAWGAPLDLVDVTAPVSGLVRLRHWGRWRSGLSLGAQGAGRWRWQCGGELRRPTREAGGEVALEFHAALGSSF